jgi:hypothetical protein
MEKKEEKRNGYMEKKEWVMIFFLLLIAGMGVGIFKKKG